MDVNKRRFFRKGLHQMNYQGILVHIPFFKHECLSLWKDSNFLRKENGSRTQL